MPLSQAARDELNSGVTTTPLPFTPGITVNPLPDARKHNPDRVAEGMRISQKTGVDALLAAERLDEFGGEMSQDKWDELVKSSPKTSAWMAKDLGNAAVAQDDTDTLSTLEKTWNSLGLEWNRAAIQREYGALKFRREFGGVLSADEEKRMSFSKAQLKTLEKQRADLMSVPGIVGLQAYSARQMLGAQGPALAGAAAGAAGGAATGATGGVIAGLINPLPGPEDVVTIGGGAVAGAGHGARLGYKAGMAFDSFRQEAAFIHDELDDLRDASGKPLDKDMKRGAAAFGGMINAALDTVGDLAILKVAPGLEKLLTRGGKDAVKVALKSPTVRAAMATYGKRIAKGVSIEAATEGAQEIISILARDSATMMSDGAFASPDRGEDLNRVLRSAVEGGVGSAGVAGTVGAPGAVRDVKQARDMKQQQAFMQSIGDAATASKLRERMPSKYRELVDEIAKGGPVENIRIPAETFATYFQTVGLDPVAVAQEVGARNFDAALAAHTDIIIPVGDYAAKIAATEHHAALMPDIRLRDGDLTAREYEAYKADRAEIDAQMATEAGQQAGGEKKDALSIIEAHFRDQLLALGRSPAVADAYATAQARPIMRLAEEAGVDPMAIIEKYGLTVTSPLPDVLTQKGNTEASIDALLERLRTGDIPQDEAIYGQRLTDFLRKAGGIQDTQGELKGRDLDKNLKPGQSRLVRDDGLPFDAALTAARQAGYLPEAPADRPDETGINDLLDALLQDEQGGVFSSKSTNDELLQLRGMLESLGGYLDSLGIDLTQIADNAQVRELMKQAGEVVGEMADGYTLAQSMDGGKPSPERIAEAARQLAEVRAQYEGTDQWMKAPNGEPTKLNERQWLQVRTPMFKEWFGDWENDPAGASKVVDANGEPAVVYHGSPDARFMNDDATFRNRWTGSTKGAHWFTPSRKTATTYADDRRAFDYQNADPDVIPAFMNLRNPSIVEANGSLWRDAQRRGKTSDVIEEAQQSGNDGVIIRDVKDDYENGKRTSPTDTMVAFDSTQIKSAIGNAGTFSGETGNALFQSAEESRRIRLRALHSEREITFIDSGVDRGGAHSPAGPESGSPAYDVALNGTYPEDFYGPNGLRYYGTGYDKMDSEMYAHLRRMEGKPNSPVTLYRSVEKDGPSKIRPGDWVTPIRSYAKDHGEGALNGEYKIIKIQAHARDIWTAGDSMLEWGYHPQPFLPEVKGNNKVLFQSALQDGTVSLNALADKGNNQAIVAQSFVNSAGLGAEQFSDVFEGAASGAQSDGFVGVPSLAAMLSHMRTAVLNDAKVLDAVVGSVPVDMVNNLFGSERAAKVALHNEAMLKDSPAFNADLPVSGAFGDATSAVSLHVREVARRTAELISRTLGPGRPSGEVIAASETSVFSQDTSSKKRAFITIGSNRKISISLLQNADLSSFLHETGHAYLEIMGDLAESAGASEQLKADWSKVLKFLKVATRAEIGVEQHEMWARANEAYLMEGNAPSAELRGVFQKFKSWLKLIYKQIEALNVKLTPEVRGVFDRLYASEAEIESAKKEAETRPLFLDAAAAGMTEAEFALYTKAIADGTENAKENLETRLMREQQRETQKWWKDARDAVKAEVTAEVEATPVYRAFAALSAGQMPDGTPIRLSRDDLVKRYGDAWLKKLPRGFGYLYAKEGGADIQTAAEMLGFSDADALVNALADMRPKKELIEAETDARMRDTYGDTLNDAEAMRQAAVSALHNDRQAEVLALELRALRKKRLDVAPFVRAERQAGQEALRDEKTRAADEAMATRVKERSEKQAARAVVDAIPPLSAFRDAAAGMISQMQARDIRPGDYLRASQKANRDAFKAMAKDDHQAAYEAKRRELLNHYLYREALAAREEVDRILDKARSFEKIATRQRIGKAGADYLEQIDGLLERWEFKRVTQRTMDRRTSLSNWAEAMEAAGHAVNVAPELLDDAKIVNFREASMDTLRAVRDALVNIEHLAGLKNKLLKKKGAVEWEAVKTELLGALAANTKSIGTLGEINRFGEPIKAKGARLWRRFDAAHLKVEQIVEWLDGGKIDGPWARYFFDLADDAQTREYDLHKEITKRLQDLSESMPKEWRDSLIERVPGFSLPGISASQTTRATLISIALNAGNTSNLDKMLRGHNWTPEQLDLALKQMGEADWRFVQGVWDTLETMWPEIAALEKRVSGVEPPRVDAREIATEWGTMRGGYYPLVYDPKRSSAGEKQADATESVQDFMARGYGRASTSKGHTKARLDEFAAPLRLDYEQVLSSHLSKVIKDVSHREAVIGLTKILKSRAIKPELIDRLGEEKYTLLNEWVQTLISDRADTLHQSLSLHNALFRGLRTNTAIVTMGWKISTMMSQIAGFGPSVDLVGYRNLSAATVEFTTHPKDTLAMVFEKSGEMRHRTNTIERDMKEQLLKLRGNPGLLAATQRTAFYLTAMADRMVSVPTWLAGYRKALAEGLAEDDAVRAGDRAVRLSQGAGGAKDLAAVQRQSELMKLLTMYYTPFSVLYARLRDVGQTTNSVRDLPQLVARSLALVILPAVLGELLAGRGPDDDEDEVWWAARKAVLYPTASVPILRDLVAWQLEPALVELTGGTMHYQPRYQFSPILSAVQKIASIPDKTLDAMTGDREWDEVAWDVFEASGYVFGLPTAQPRITGEYLTDLMGGDANPESIGEALHDLAFRRPRQ